MNEQMKTFRIVKKKSTFQGKKLERIYLLLQCQEEFPAAFCFPLLKMR